MHSKYQEKIKSVNELKKIIGPHPREKKVIMCHGTFDIVHPGHIRHLMYVREKADILIVSVTSDAHIHKANVRPYVPELLRALNLAAFEMVDYVVVDKNPTPLENLQTIQPDYFAKGYEYISDGLHPKTSQEQKVVESYGGEVLFTPGDIVYSSSSIIENSPPNVSTEKLIMLLDAENITFSDLRNTLKKFADKTVHVVGDTIVDSYTHTSMIGGQTKTPTLSVKFENRTDFVGGAGIVAKHLKAAGAKVIFTTILGDDQLQKFVLDDLEKTNIDTINAITDQTRPTTNKNAIVCQNYRMVKIDTLDNRCVTEKIAQQITELIRSTPADAVVFSDFRHGIFSKTTIPKYTNAIPFNAFRVADSQVASRWGNILEFQGFDLITPNEREARFSLGDQDSVVRPLALKLYKESNCKNLILKLGERGVLSYRKRMDENDVRSFFIIDSFVEHLVDGVGAGDALLAYATLAHIATGNEIIASVLGAIAAAVECERDGNIPVTPEDVLQKLDLLEQRVSYKTHKSEAA